MQVYGDACLLLVINAIETAITFPFHDVFAHGAIRQAARLLQNEYALVPIEERAFEHGFGKVARGNSQVLRLSLPRDRKRSRG